MVRQRKSGSGLRLAEMVIVVVLVGVIATAAAPKLKHVRRDAEQSSVAAVVGALESALSVYVSRQNLAGDCLEAHNPFTDLSITPQRYVGERSSLSQDNVPPGHWAWYPQRDWVVYHPVWRIKGGWQQAGDRFIVLQFDPVVDGPDTVGLRLTTQQAFSYQWE